MYQDLSTQHDWPVKKPIVILPIRMKGNSKRISVNSFVGPLGAKNQDLALLRQRYLLELDYVCDAQAGEFNAISSFTECAPLLTL